MSRIAERFQNLPQTITVESHQRSPYNFSKPFTTTVSSYGIASNSNNKDSADLSSKWEHYDNNPIDNRKSMEDDPMDRLRLLLKEHSPQQRQISVIIKVNLKK